MFENNPSIVTRGLNLSSPAQILDTGRCPVPTGSLWSQPQSGFNILFPHGHDITCLPLSSSLPPPGSLSDDPLFPKAPWPSPSLCSSCHEEKNGVHVWNHGNVLLFLRQHYGASNLSPKYSLTPPRLPAPPPDPDPVQTSRPQEGGGGEQLEPGPGHQVQKEDERREVVGLGGGGVWTLGLGFTSVDLSLCVVLYVCSCLFLMLLFFFFRVRSRRWKLRYSRFHV